LQLQGTIDWNTNIVLTGDTLINCFPSGYSQSINGVISGTGNLTRIGPATLTIGGSSANTFDGDTYLNEGLTLLNKPGGSAFPSPNRVFIAGANTNAEARELASFQVDYVTVGKDGLLNLNGQYDYLGDLVLNDGGDVQTGAGTLDLSNVGSTLAVSNGAAGGHSTISGNLNANAILMNVLSGATLDVLAAVSGSGFTKTGVGNAYLFSSNSYDGLTIVGDGILWVSNSVALGTTNYGTVVSNGATLVLVGAIGVTNESLTLNGSGESSSWGALDAEYAQTNIWAGPITVNAESTISPWLSTSVLRIIGPITGSGGVTKIGSGTLYFEGSTANTYAGTTRVNSGTLLLKKSVPDGAVPHGLVINGRVQLLALNQIADVSDVTIGGAGLLSLNGYSDYIDELSGGGAVDLGTEYLVIGDGNGSSTYGGVISGTGRLYKFGSSGTITLTGDNLYTGITYVDYGKLVINGYQPQSTAYVWTTGTLGGSGTVGEIYVSSSGGRVAPGTSSGILTCSNVTFTSSSGHYAVDLQGPAAGTGYDQLNVRGTNTLANAALDINLAFTTPVAVGQQFTIINNDGTDLITGVFNGYPEGSYWLQNGFKVVISYFGGSGNNDVVLRLTEVPGVAGAVAVTTGNGDHVIDPNECNNLSLTISNQSGAIMSGVTATLSTTTPGVIISQPYSPYPDIPVNGTALNTTPFQITTLPTFACGTEIDVQLIVQSSLGAFTLPFVLSSGTPAVTANRYDNNTVTNVPDIGTIESTNTVSSWSGGPLTKIAVSLWLVAPFSADMNLTLIAPNGATVDLSSGNGTGANFGTGTADAVRTTFDDDAAMSITAGASPFVGTFRPETSLASLLTSSAVGNWRLRIQDLYGSSYQDTLRAWSLFLYGTTCTSGGGACDLCLAPITGSITNTDLAQTNRIFRDSVIASCGLPKDWPGTQSGSYYYDVYGFTNTTGADACVTVKLTSAGDAQAALYLGSFDPLSISNNYVADAGPTTSTNTFSGTVPAGAPFYVTVNEVHSGAGCPSYALQLSGLLCPPPTLAISPAGTPNNVRVYWPTWAGGYQLEARPTVVSGAWGNVTTEPIVSGGRYNVTNQSLVPPERFYRLQKSE
jgi:autotransporter-associated beta strand protein